MRYIGPIAVMVSIVYGSPIAGSGQSPIRVEFWRGGDHNIQFADFMGRRLGTSAGSCWEHDLSASVGRAVRDSTGVARRFR